MKNWMKTALVTQVRMAVLASAVVAGSAWAVEDAGALPDDATAVTAEDAQAPPADVTQAEDIAADASATGEDAASGQDSATAGDASGDASSIPGDATATGDGDGHGKDGDSGGGCTAGPTSNSPVALGLAGAVLGWLVSRSRKPAPAQVKK